MATKSLASGSGSGSDKGMQVTVDKIVALADDKALSVEKVSSSRRSSREKSPGVSFAEEVFSFEDRQYATVHAGTAAVAT